MKSIPASANSANPDRAIKALRSFMHQAFAPTPANDAGPRVHVPALSKSTARAVETARLHLRHGNPGAYARALAGEHRAVTDRQQRAIEAVIACDGQERLFSRHPANGCLLAKEC